MNILSVSRSPNPAAGHSVLDVLEAPLAAARLAAVRLPFIAHAAADVAAERGAQHADGIIAEIP